MINFDSITPQVQTVQDLRSDPQDLGIREHRIVGAGDIEITLVKFPHPAFGHSGLIAAVHLGDVVAFYVLDRWVHGEPACERDR